jgi:enamine deaminase RidA (YjgF/YER057c/UK114 family)
MNMTFDERVMARLRGLGLALPEPAKPAGSYLPVVEAGGLLFVSGQFPRADGKLTLLGKVGADLTFEEGCEAARLCALGVLSQIRAYLGSLDRLKQIVRLEGHVASAPGFFDQPGVLDGASDLFVELLEDRGRHSRSALSHRQLPLNASIELVVTAQAL